jgi:branched-chain amino acid transport system permease protein
VAGFILVSIPAGVLVAGVGALIIGAIVIRTSGVYFLMLTLAFGQLIYALAFKWIWLTGGSNGLSAIHRLQLPGGLELADPRTLYYVILAICALSLWALWRVVNSSLGHTFVGIRENESRMRAAGYDTQRYKLVAFVIAGLFAGLAGALHVAFTRFVAPEEVLWTASGQVMIMVIVGGAGTLVGPLLGAAFVLLLQNWVSSLPAVGDQWQAIMGIVFVAFVLFARGGIVRVFDRVEARRARPAAPRVVSGSHA